MHIHDGLNGPGISRRKFLRTGTLAAAAVPAFSSWTLAAPTADAPVNPSDSQAFVQSPDFLQSSKGAAQWIESAQKKTSQGVYWLPEPDHPEKEITVSAANAIYSGSGGTVLFFLQLANATGDQHYLQQASLGADYLVETWRDLVDKASAGLLSAPGLNLSLYGGMSGVAFVLNEAAKATNNSKYLDAARAATDVIVQAAKPLGAGVAWSNAAGIAGDGGIILYLLYAAREFHNPGYLALAEKAGDRIL